MIPKAITVPFRWWAKHPWVAFWVITPIVLLYINIPSNNALIHFVQVLVIAWILSWFRGVFVIWQRSKFEAVLAVSATFAIPIILIQTIFSHRPHYNPDNDVKANIKNAATAQEAYFVDHDTYTTNIGSLTGYNQSSNVTISAEATTTTYVITGTATKRCKPDTGTWSINSTTGEITGTRCR